MLNVCCKKFSFISRVFLTKISNIGFSFTNLVPVHMLFPPVIKGSTMNIILVTCMALLVLFSRVSYLHNITNIINMYSLK